VELSNGATKLLFLKAYSNIQSLKLPLKSTRVRNYNTEIPSDF